MTRTSRNLRSQRKHLKLVKKKLLLKTNPNLKLLGSKKWTLKRTLTGGRRAVRPSTMTISMSSKRVKGLKISMEVNS